MIIYLYYPEVLSLVWRCYSSDKGHWLGWWKPDRCMDDTALCLWITQLCTFLPFLQG